MGRDAGVKFTTGIAGQMLQRSLVTLDRYFTDKEGILRKESFKILALKTNEV